MKIKFKEENFNSLKDLENSLKEQIKGEIYVGTNNLIHYINCPKKLLSSNFNSGREQQKQVSKKFGPFASVIDDKIAIVYEYPKKLIAMLRPYPPETKLDFELKPANI